MKCWREIEFVWDSKVVPDVPLYTGANIAGMQSYPIAVGWKPPNRACSWSALNSSKQTLSDAHCCWAWNPANFDSEAALSCSFRWAARYCNFRIHLPGTLWNFLHNRSWANPKSLSAQLADSVIHKPRELREGYGITPETLSSDFWCMPCQLTRRHIEAKSSLINDNHGVIIAQKQL